MTDAQLQLVANAAAEYIRAKLLVPVEFEPVASASAVQWPKRETCLTCGATKPTDLIETSEAALTQPDIALFLRSECKGVLDAIAGELNGAGAAVNTHALLLPQGLQAKALGLSRGVMVRALVQFDVSTANTVLRFDVLYSKKQQ
jgi:hypothetical protein